MALDPSNPRSLVGATMGARKRAAHRDLLEREAAHRDMLEREAAARTADEAAGRARSAAWFVQSLRFRESLHIGERLRPCPGCCGCNPGPNCPCSDATYCCNGSGTLPATRSRAATPGGADE